MTIDISIKKLVISTLAITTIISIATTANAQAPSPDILEAKGYSPQTIKTVETMTTRHQWEIPKQEMTPFRRILHNIYLNDLAGNMDPFGSEIIRERQ